MQATDELGCCATAMRKASRRLTQLYDDALAPSGLRSTQYSILRELERSAKAPPTIQELADRLVMDRSALGHGIKPLERDGLIETIEGGEDRRRRHISLTAEGRVKCREAKALWKKAQARFTSTIGEVGAAALRAQLLAIAHDERLA